MRKLSASICLASIVVCLSAMALSFSVGAEHAHSYKLTYEIKPSCTESGLQHFTCSCGENYYKTTEPLGHLYTSSVTLPTCTKDGQLVKTCKRCGYVKKERIICPGHDFESKYTTDKKPTCTAAGSKSRHCTRCSKKTDITQIPATGHSYSKKKTTKKATFTGSGEAACVCSKCSAKKDKSTIYQVSSVKLSKTVFTYNAKSQKPTVTVKDSKGTILKSGRDYKLTYQKDSTSIGTHTVTVKLCGNYSGSKTLKYNILPQNVSSVSAKSTCDSISLSWKKLSGGVKYRIYLYNSKDKSYKLLSQTDKTSCKITKLKSGTGYTFCLRAVKTVGGKNFFSEKITNVKCACLPQSVKLSAKAVSENGVRLSWSKTRCTGYQIYMKSDGDYTKIKTVSSGAENIHYQNYLKKSKSYTFKIRTYFKFGNKVYYSAFSSPVTIRIK